MDRFSGCRRTTRRARACPRVRGPARSRPPRGGRVSATSIVTPSLACSTRTWATGPPCLTTLVSASCTTRYAARSTPAGTSPRSPVTSRVTPSPVRRTSAASVFRSASPGDGVTAAGSLPSRRAPSIRRISTSASRLVCSMTPRAVRAPAGSVSMTWWPAPGLDRDERDGVRDDVVQLTRDPQPFGHRGRPGALVAFPLEQPGPLLHPGPPGPALADVVGGQPRDRGGEEGGDPVVGLGDRGGLQGQRHGERGRGGGEGDEGGAPRAVQGEPEKDGEHGDAG